METFWLWGNSAEKKSKPTTEDGSEATKNSSIQ
jgi:hypothetical protein